MKKLTPTQIWVLELINKGGSLALHTFGQKVTVLLYNEHTIRLPVKRKTLNTLL